MYPQNPNTPAPTFGGIQQNFTFQLRTFKPNDQFTIVEDLPSTKPIRKVMKMSIKPNPRSGKPEPYTIFAIRIKSGGFEADLELFETELNMLAIACPKDIKNFRGTTLAFDGFKWHYICGDMPDVGTPQPVYQPPVQDQTDTFIQSMVNSIKAINAIGTDVTSGDMIKIADRITPGKALDLIAMGKTKGYIIESNGIFKAV